MKIPDQYTSLLANTLYIQGNDCRDGFLLSFPLASTAVMAGLDRYKQEVQEKISNTTHTLQETENIDLPPELRDNIGENNANQVLNTIVDNLQRKYSNERESLVCLLGAEVVVVFEGTDYPLRNVCLVNALDVFQKTILEEEE